LITEGASSNFFVVQEGRLVTAPEEMVLPGVTRALVLDMARKSSLPSEERRVYLSEQKAWDEAFITSTSRKVLPVTRVDGEPVGEGRVGPLTRRLMEVFDLHDRRYLADHSPRGQSQILPGPEEPT
jgi:D-alanine transaminase